ncbi:MAG: hypothetical protein H0U81_08415 [Pyrinomonadaceae bacterium]|nr:hypothetical protein [Pyrinomonadaceae bacterium]
MNTLLAGHSMAFLPLDQKQLIQSSYVRYRELRKELPGARQKVVTATVVFWGSLVVFIWAFILVVIDEELPEIVSAVALAGILFGLLFGLRARKSQRALRGERDAIELRMREIGVHFCDSLEELRVYANEIQEENEMSVLHDGSYR